MAIGLGAAVTELDLGARGKLAQSLLGFGDEWPGTVAARGKGCDRCFGIDEPHDCAVGQRQGLSVPDLGHGGLLPWRQIASECGG